MAFTCDISFRLNPQAVPQMNAKLAIAWKRATQECVAAAKQWRPQYIVTQNNVRSINPGGSVNSSGAMDVDPNNIVLEVYTTSGYGGYLEVGTRWMDALPYLYPAVMAAMKAGGRGAMQLVGCLN